MISVNEAGNPIWERRFACKVKQKDLSSPEYIETYGRPYSRNKNRDKELLEEYVDVYITINDIIEYFKRNAYILITNPEDTKNIYDIVEKYLNAWSFQLDSPFNASMPPLDDIVLLGEFLEILFNYSKSYTYRPNPNDIFAKFNAFSGHYTPTVDISTLRFHNVADVIMMKIIDKTKGKNKIQKVNNNLFVKDFNGNTE